ncbi:MAG: AAA family ATPase [Gemmatimonadota bacterium]|nr:MAG: AAA family ATPase [Gemmatimonadota bacterium]
MIEIQALGPPTVLVDGSDPPAELLWRKHLALLIYLARSPRGRTRDQLIGLLWPDKAESKARHSLNEALRVIRRVAGDALVTEGDAVKLEPGVVAIDADDPESASIRGIFLEGFGLPDAPAFEDWMSGERQKLRAVSLKHLIASAEQAISLGELEEGRRLAQRALDIEPLHEPAVRVVMRAHALEGSRTLAIQAFDRLKELLSRDLDIEPSRDTQELAERIRTERIVRGAPAVEGVPLDVVPLVGPGREALARGLSVWEQAQDGRPGVVVLRGDPGTGKTRLGDEMASRARLDGAVVAQGRVLEKDTVAAVWSALMRGGLTVPELGGAAPGVLAALATFDPDILVRFPAARDAGPAETVEPFSQAVFAIAEVRPVLLVLDDVHRADAALVESCGAIVQRAGNARVCLVVTATIGPAAEHVDVLNQRVGRDVAGEIVSTGVFEENDVAELVAWAFPEYDADAVDRLKRRVMAETAGIPFLAVEFVRAVSAGLVMKEEKVPAAWPDKHRTLDQTIPGALPETVAAALRLRFRGLTADAQAMLIAVAVIGGNEPVELLAKAADISSKRAERALDELEWQRWLAGDAHGYAFVTKLAGDIVLADMVTAGQKRRVQKRAAKAK